MLPIQLRGRLQHRTARQPCPTSPQDALQVSFSKSSASLVTSILCCFTTHVARYRSKLLLRWDGAAWLPLQEGLLPLLLALAAAPGGCCCCCNALKALQLPSTAQLAEDVQHEHKYDEADGRHNHRLLQFKLGRRGGTWGGCGTPGRLRQFKNSGWQAHSMGVALQEAYCAASCMCCKPEGRRRCTHRSTRLSSTETLVPTYRRELDDRRVIRIEEARALAARCCCRCIRWTGRAEPVRQQQTGRRGRRRQVGGAA